MYNLEGINNVETLEKRIEKDSIKIKKAWALNFDDCIKTEDNNTKQPNNLDFNNCFKTNEDKIKELLELKEALSFAACKKEEQDSQIVDDFEDCRKR